jgi:D-3-phosphoglycerate dehydrogenase
MFKVAVVGPIHEKGMRLLRDREDVEIVPATDLSPSGIAGAVRGADAITVRTQTLSEETLALAPGLRIVSRHGVGFDNVDVASLSRRGIPMAIAADSNYTAVAEHTLMMMLCLAKDTFASDRAVREGNFGYRNRGTPTDLLEKEVLIMGFGRIGRRVATLCLAFGMRVSACDPYVETSPVAGVEMVKDFRSALPRIDYLSLHMPATPESAGMIGEKELRSMRPHACIVNCARGGMVDETLLARCLEEGVIKGAGMDVFAAEPNDPSHPLFRRMNCVFSPHNAALSVECSIRMATQCARNVLDCLDGKLDPRVVVNAKEIGMQCFNPHPAPSAG